MFELLGDKPETRSNRSTIRNENRDRAGARIDDTRRPPRSQEDFTTSLSVAELEKLTPAFGWKEYFRQIGLSGITFIERSGAGVL
jgi:hypothetical protein